MHIPSFGGVQPKQVSTRVKMNITEEAMGGGREIGGVSATPRRKRQEMVNQLVENLAQLVRAERLMEQGIPVDEAWKMTCWQMGWQSPSDCVYACLISWWLSAVDGVWSLRANSITSA